MSRIKKKIGCFLFTTLPVVRLIDRQCEFLLFFLFILLPYLTSLNSLLFSFQRILFFYGTVKRVCVQITTTATKSYSKYICSMYTCTKNAKSGENKRKEWATKNQRDGTEKKKKNMLYLHEMNEEKILASVGFRTPAESRRL